MSEQSIQQMPILKENEWVIISEDGIWFSTTEESKASYVSKKEAIWEVSSSKLDPNLKTKVKRVAKGWYEYFPKDCDTGTYGECYDIRKITAENIQEFKQMVKTQWDEDPLAEYNEE